MFRFLSLLALPSIASASSMAQDGPPIVDVEDLGPQHKENLGPTQVNMEDLARTVTLAEDALLLHSDRTSHLDEALEGFLDNYESARDNTGLYAKRPSNHKKQEQALMKQLEDLIRLVNVRQLEQLSVSLKDALEDELKRRSYEPPPAEPTIPTKPKKFPVSASYLEGMFDVETVLGKSESILEQWIAELIDQEIQSLVNETTSEIVEELSTPKEVVLGPAEDDEEEDDNDEDDVGDHCVSTATAAQEVQSALLSYSQDGIGRQDHAQGGVIVHEMTSPSYIPGARDKERLGAWSKFIPEEIEELLPDGWVDWEIPRVPGTYGSASPRAILHADTTPGSCWPMQGQAGYATFRLPYPVKVNAVSLDHASHLLLSSGFDQKESAPKQVKVYGFPPCDTDGGCGGLGLDANDKYLLTEINYDIDGPSTQTFAVGKGDDVEQEEILGGSGSCSATTATCGAPLSDNTAAAIRVEVESNWGNQAFTCLYRVRVHGERI